MRQSACRVASFRRASRRSLTMSEKLSPNNTKPQVKVFVPTYRRRRLLPRALNSLRAQTFADWVCEVHNDDPTDTFPKELVKDLGDPRIKLHNHEHNLGAIATFNLFYRPTREPFYSLLEDDNWWLPEFLGTMIRAMDSHPNVTMAWCNQRVSEELADGSWRDTGHLVNPPEQTRPASRAFWRCQPDRGRTVWAGSHADALAVWRDISDTGRLAIGRDRAIARAHDVASIAVCTGATGHICQDTAKRSFRKPRRMGN